MNKEALYQLIHDNHLLVVARGNPTTNPYLDMHGEDKRIVAALSSQIASAVQVYQFDLYFDAASNAVELCIDPNEHRPAYAYEQINQFEKRFVCNECKRLRGEYLATKGERAPILEYDFSDKRK